MQMDDLTRQYAEAHEEDGAHIRIRPWQVVWYIALLGALGGLLVWRWDVFLYSINFFFAFLYFGVILFRAAAICFSLLGIGIVQFRKNDVTAIPDEELPIYTILIPLYKEAGIADKIVASLDKMDYPPEKLDIKLLLEADDDETQNAIAAIDLPPRYDVIVVPDGKPKTKPRACNYGLARAKGEFCVIYDAEDRPDPDQLRKAVWAFRQQPDRIACLQAKLNFYNSKQNLLTRWFTIEYSTWFDLFLPGLQIMHVPIPLGGTSNHFRTNVLRELDGWDPFNVTEDCDLGVRIYKKGFRTLMIDSTTWEEANSQPWNWVRQRSRWVKGFFQTHLAHMRHPFKTLVKLNPWGFFGFLMSVGGSSLMMVMNVFYWLIGVIYVGLLYHGMTKGAGLKEMIFSGGQDKAMPILATIRGFEIRAWPLVYHGAKQDKLWATLSIVFFVIVCTLILANLLFIGMHVAACLKRRLPHLIPAALLMPIYWVMISFAAWKGVIQLITKPFYWEKTNHGLDGG